MNAAQNEGLDEAVKRLLEAMTVYRLHLASPENPMDATELIVNPSFESGNDGWQFSGMGTQGNSDFRKVGNTYAETWSEWGTGAHDAKLWQTLTNLPNGRYKLTAVAQNIQQATPNMQQTGCFIFAGDSRTEVGVYGTYAVEFVSVSGEVTIGFQTLNATGNYCCVDDFHLSFLGFDEEAEQAAFTELIKQAEELVGKDMNTATKEALQTAINSAKSLKASGNIDTDKVATADYIMEKGIFAYNVLNGSGTVPKVTTGEVIVGSSAMAGRMSATGNKIIERGFCWAENPNPTVLDEHSSNNQSNDVTNYSPVYVLYNVQPSTIIF